jgi:lysophospholipase L1-like esterase
VVLGSSTAEGVGPAAPDSAWVERYRARLERIDPAHRITNLARGGYTTYQIQPDGFTPPPDLPLPDGERNISRALSLHPDAIVINLPSNDATAGYGVDAQLANLDRVLAAATGAGIPVWISTTQPRNLSPSGRDNLMAMRDSTFARFGNRAVDFWRGLAEAQGTIDPAFDCGDGIHLNDAGHRILSERVDSADIPGAITRRGAVRGSAPD